MHSCDTWHTKCQTVNHNVHHTIEMNYSLYSFSIDSLGFYSYHLHGFNKLNCLILRVTRLPKKVYHIFLWRLLLFKKTLMFNKTFRPRIVNSLNKNKNVFDSISFHLKKIKITFLIQNYHVTFVNVTSVTKAVPWFEHLLTSIETKSYLGTERTQLLKDEDSSDLLKKSSHRLL